MTPHSASSTFHGHDSTGLSDTTIAATGLSRWIFDPRLRPASRSSVHEEREALIQERTRELEHEIAALREEVDRRAAMEQELARVGAELETAAAAKSAFFAALTHELRAPLHGIVGTIDVLGDTALNAEQSEMVQVVRQSGEWLLGIVDEILDFSKIEAGKLRLESLEFDLTEQLQFAVDLHSAAAARKGLELIVDVAAAVPPRLRGDPVRLRQVIVNLLNNAVKFTREGEVAVRVGLEKAAAGRLRFEIADTGIGIPPEAQRVIFEPFAQAETSTARAFGGTGLGLAICKRLVDLMGGEIGVASTAAGTTFWFEVPLEAAGERGGEGASAAPSLAGRHVLIVDDNATNRDVFIRLAADWKMLVGTAATAEAALGYLSHAAAGGRPVDIVVLDHDIRGVDGLAVAHAIQAEAKLPVPTLAMLAPRTYRIGDEELRAAGIALFERKPIHPKRLEAMLSRARQRVQP